MKVIAYDVGTTGLKTCMFRVSAGESVEYLAGEVEYYQLHVLPNGGVEQDPADWWDAMARSTRRLLERSGTAREEIRGVTFCSQFQTVVMVDRDGRPLRGRGPHYLYVCGGTGDLRQVHGVGQGPHRPAGYGL